MTRVRLLLDARLLLVAGVHWHRLDRHWDVHRKCVDTLPLLALAPRLRLRQVVARRRVHPGTVGWWRRGRVRRPKLRRPPIPWRGWWRLLVWRWWRDTSQTFL